MNVKGKMPAKPMMKKGEHMMGNMPMANAEMERMRKDMPKPPAKKSGKK